MALLRETTLDCTVPNTSSSCLSFVLPSLFLFSSTSATMGKQTTLQLQNLSVEQLRAIKEQLDNDLQSLGRAHENLRVARIKFQESRASVEQFKQLPEGHKSMIPLSASLYVEGELADTQNVLVDVGTGYFIKQSGPRASDFFQRRIQSLSASMDDIAEAIGNARRQQSSVTDVMRSKMAARSQAHNEAA